MTNDLVKRLDAYFAMGGLFNPELADHQAVSDLLKDCRARITELEKALEPIKARLEDREKFDEALYGMPSSDEKEIYVRMGDLRAVVRPLKTKEHEQSPAGGG
jgi:hypothetical protein